MQPEPEKPDARNRDAMPSGETTKPKRWGKRLGVFAFMFFLIKGLLWLIVPAALVYFGWGAEK